MNFPNKSCRIFLASISICFFMPQVEAGLWDDVVNKVKNVAEDITDDTADDMTSEDEKSASSSSSADSSTASVQKKKTVNNSTPADTSSVVENAQMTTSAQTSASQLSKVDIAGLKLGMSQEQAVAALKAHNKELHIAYEKFEIVKPDDNDPMSAWRASAQASNLSPVEHLLPDYLKAIHASVSGNSSESITLEFAEPPSANVVKYIVRTNRFDPSARPSKDNVLAALTKKYGVTTNKGKRVLAWNYSSDDNSVIKEKCTTAIEYAVVQRDSLDMRGNAHCGLVLTVKISSDDVIAFGLDAVLANYSETERQRLATEDYHVQLLQERDARRKKDGDQNSLTL